MYRNPWELPHYLVIILKIKEKNEAFTLPFIYELENQIVDEGKFLLFGSF